MATRTDCFPWFHAVYAGMSQRAVPSGCATVGGNVNCSPESMRAAAEARGKAEGWWPSGKSMSLGTYSVARYITSEVGSGTIEERVAVAEAVVNRARLARTDVNGMLLYRQPSGHPNRGYYGPIHGAGGTSTAPYGRWAATSKDPTNVNLLLADLVLSGKSGNFAMGADDQNGMEYFDSPSGNVRKEADQGDYWVGPLPGVDHWHTFLYRHWDVSPSSALGAALLKRGLDAVANRSRPQWGGLPVCAGGAPLGTGEKIALGFLLAVGLGGGFLVGRRFVSQHQPAIT